MEGIKDIRTESSECFSNSMLYIECSFDKWGREIAYLYRIASMLLVFP